MTPEDAARSLGALGNPTRLWLYRALVRSGPAGLTVGALNRIAEAPASTVAFHLDALRRAGLVTQEQRGREVRTRPDFALMNRLLTFLTAECCSASPEESPCPDSSSP